MDKTVPNISVAFDFGDDSTIESSTLHINEPLPQWTTDYVGVGHGNFVVNEHRYADAGPYNVKAIVSQSDGLGFTQDKWITVKQCTSPSVSINGAGSSISSPVQYDRHDRIYLNVTYTSNNCMLNYTVVAKWWIHKQELDKKYAIVTSPDSIASLSIEIPAYSLDLGNNQIEAKVNLFIY